MPIVNDYNETLVPLFLIYRKHETWLFLFRINLVILNWQSVQFGVQVCVWGGVEYIWGKGLEDGDNYCAGKLYDI